VQLPSRSDQEMKRLCSFNPGDHKVPEVPARAQGSCDERRCKSVNTHCLVTSDILVLKLISVLVFILFSSQNFLFYLVLVFLDQ